jgi:hypothetical protein
MKNLLKFQFLLVAILFIGSFVINSCKKEEPEPEPEDTITSDSIAKANLIAKFSFEGNINDAKNNITGGTATGITYDATGAKGQSYIGADDGYVLYTNPGTVKNLTSLTVAFWIKTTVHTDGAECVFMLNNTDSWIGDLFLLQESGTIGVDSIRFKFRISDWDPAVTWKEQWIDLNGTNRIAGIDGQWAHLAFTYDGASSKFYVFLNGTKLTMPSDVTDRIDNEGGNPLGDLLFNTAGNTHFIFGSYQYVVNAGTPDGWMKNFNGELDEFRIYNKALSEGEIQQLYELELAGN